MGRKFGWHSGKLKCRELEVDQSLSLGSLDFGSVELDTILLNGRFTTSSIAGAALSLGATYTYPELMEMRCTVTSWTGIAGSFKGYYFRAETTSGNASYGIRGMEIFGVANITSGTTGLANCDGLYVEQCIKHGAASWTLGGYNSAIEANISLYTGAGTLTITNYTAALKARVQGANGVADYTKIHGIVIECRDNESSTRKFGSAITIQDPSDPYASDWTVGLNITAGCTTAISIGTATTGITLTGTYTTAISGDSATITPDAARSKAFLTFGDRTAAKTVDLGATAGVAFNFDPMQMSVSITDTGGLLNTDSTINLTYMNLAHTTSNMANLRLKCSDWNIVVRKNVKDVYCMQGEVDFDTNSVTVSGEAAVLGLVMNCASAVTGTVRGLIISMQGAGMPASAMGLEIRNDAAAATLRDGINISAAGVITNGIKMEGTMTRIFDFTTIVTAVSEDDLAAPNKAGSIAILTPAGAVAYINYYDGTRA